MSTTNCWNLRVTAEVDQGGRRYMEDVTSVQFERAKGDKKVIEYAAFAVFDGHGGKEAAHFARDHIMNNIKSQKGFFSKDVDVVKKAIRDGFTITHHQMWNALPNWPKTYNGHPSTAGTTASLVLIRGNKMYVANVGDSMVVMGTRMHRYKENQRAFQAWELTVDHKPELPEERKRIECCGGCVMNKAGVNRVVWNRPKISHTGPIRRSTKLDKIPFLAIARSLGDLWSFNSEKNEFVVSPIPDVHVYDLVDGREQFIILASDGLWNMVRPCESVSSVGTFDDRRNKNEVSGTPAHELVQLALDRWKMRSMRADNTSVIVVYIERKKMEIAVKKRDTYTESWTSARLSGSKFKSDTIPFQSDDSEKAADLSNDSDEVKVTGPSVTNEDVPGPPRSDTEPVQDSSISSSSGEAVSNDNLMAETSRPGRVVEPSRSSSKKFTDDDTVDKELSTPSRRITRRLSNDMKMTNRRSTRSLTKKESGQTLAKRTLKRRNSAGPASVRRSQGHKRCRTEDPAGPSSKHRTRSAERTAGKTVFKTPAKTTAARRSRSEPVLASLSKNLRVRKTPGMQPK